MKARVDGKVEVVHERGEVRFGFRAEVVLV